MDAAFRHPRVMGAEKVFVDVFEENKRAINLYMSYGFSPVGKIGFKIGEEVVGYDLVLMRIRGLAVSCNSDI